MLERIDLTKVELVLKKRKKKGGLLALSTGERFKYFENRSEPDSYGIGRMPAMVF